MPVTLHINWDSMKYRGSLISGFTYMYTLSKISNWSLFKLIISDQALIALK